jgi:transposase
MKPLTISDTEDVVLAIQDEIRRSDEARYDHRLHALLLVAQGMSSNKAARLLGDAPRTVAYWVRRFEEEGFAGLVDGDHPGRPRRLSDARIEEIASALRKEPAQFGLGGQWDGKTLSRFIEQQWGISLGVRQCQRLFRHFGFRLRKPRPKIAHANGEAQAEYKKTAPPLEK